MKTKMKASISVFLALCLLLGVLPAAAIPAEAASTTDPLITNGGFEDGTEGWTAGVDGTISAVADTLEVDDTASEGDYAAKLSADKAMS